MKLFTRYLLWIVSVLLIPFTAAEAQVNDIFDGESLIYDLLTRLAWLLWAVAFMVFTWGLVKFISNASDTAEHEKGKQFIVWGII